MQVKKKRILFRLKVILCLLLMLIELISLGFLSYSLILYSGVETFYRIFAILILIYALLFISYMLIRGTRKKTLKSFIIPAIISILFTVIQFVGFYYLNSVYKAINAYSDNENMYYSSLITYDLSLENHESLKDKKIGIVEDTSDIEAYTLPLEIIDELKLEKENKIIKYTSTMELLNGVKEKEVDAAFFSSNYVDMFSSLEGYETIETDTKELYKGEKEYIVEDTISNEASSLTKPFTMLFIGVDASKDGVTSGYNADVLILVTFNPETLRATMTSVPRDMYLKTACSGNAYRRINTTTWGSSSECAVNTIEKLFDVNVDYYAKINFKGIVQLVDALGGIDVDVPYSFCEQSSSRKWGSKTVYVNKGKQHLNGEQALALARNRHYPNDGSTTGKYMGKYCADRDSGKRNDYTRGKNQMKVILGIVEAATKLRDPNQAIEILETIKRNFQTNIKTKDVLALYNLGKSIILTDSSSLVNVQRSQLSGYSAYGHVYDVSSKSYPAVTIPYNGSINDIKNQIKINLGKKKATTVKKVKFNLNDLFEDTVIGSGSYSQSKIKTLPNVKSYSVSELNSYAAKNGLKLKFLNVDTREEVSLTSYGDYKFHSQKEHKDTILDQISTLTIYVKKVEVIAPVVPETPTETPTEPTTPEITPEVTPEESTQ